MNEAHFLGVSAVSHRLVLVVLQDDVPEAGVGNIFYNVPLGREAAGPFILLPEVHVPTEVNVPSHLRHPTKLPTGVDLQRRNTYPHLTA